MAEEDFEVPSPHEHAVEHAAGHGHGGEHTSLAQRVALTTAILATIGALFSYQSGANQNKALFLKNESIQKQAEATDQWSYYQARSTKEHLNRIGSLLSNDPKVKGELSKQAQHEATEKEKAKNTAEGLEAEAHKLSQESEEVLRPHERMALGMTFIQIAIALASITVLTRKRWLFIGSLASAAVGIVVAMTGFF